MSTLPESTSLGRLERRKAGRIRCIQTVCQLGAIGDVSRDGCRIVSKKPVEIPANMVVKLELVSPGATVTIIASQVSCRKRPDGKYDVGMRFHHTDDESRRAVIALARSSAQSCSGFFHPLCA